MLKYLLLALLIIWLFYSPALRRQLHRSDRQPPSQPPAEPPSPQVMRTCAHCGVHFPENEGQSQTQSGRTFYYCCADHLRAGPRSS